MAILAIAFQDFAFAGLLAVKTRPQRRPEQATEAGDVGQGVGDPAAPDDVADGKLARQEVGDGDVITQHRDHRDNPGDR